MLRHDEASRWSHIEVTFVPFRKTLAQGECFRGLVLICAYDSSSVQHEVLAVQLRQYTMEHLTKLFGSPARVKLIRLFLFNQTATYDRDAVVMNARITPDVASKELALLARAGVIKRRSFFKEVIRAGTKLPSKRRTLGWMLDVEYPFLAALTRFFRETLAVSDAEIRKRLRNIGTVKLVVTAGFLIGEDGGALDLLVVGDRVDENALRAAIRALESESGKEIRYAVLSTEEYQYRRRVRDKLMRDIFDFPHREVVNKVGVV